MDFFFRLISFSFSIMTYAEWRWYYFNRCMTECNCFFLFCLCFWTLSKLHIPLTDRLIFSMNIGSVGWDSNWRNKHNVKLIKNVKMGWLCIFLVFKDIYVCPWDHSFLFFFSFVFTFTVYCNEITYPNLQSCQSYGDRTLLKIEIWWD
mgnify:CR=1 FL=1